LVTSFRSFIGSGIKTTTVDDIIKSAENSLANSQDTSIGIIPFSPSINEESVQASIPFTADQIIAVNNSRIFFTLTVEIKYVNLVTKKPYYYIQVSKIATIPAFSATSLKYNDDPQ
jgi:hypothetical protein